MIFIEGRVEFSYDIDNLDDDHAWQTWMNISAMDIQNDSVGWQILGKPTDVEYKSTIQNRGFPKNPSNDLKRDIDFINKNKLPELFGFTHLFFSEIENLELVENTESDWLKLFVLIRAFMNLKKLNSNQIRLTIWYNW